MVTELSRLGRRLMDLLPILHLVLDTGQPSHGSFPPVVLREGSTVAEHSETYKGRRIMVRPRIAEATTERAAGEGAEPELYIYDKPVFTVRISSGAYIAAGFAFAPE